MYTCISYIQRNLSYPCTATQTVSIFYLIHVFLKINCQGSINEISVLIIMNFCICFHKNLQLVILKWKLI